MAWLGCEIILALNPSGWLRLGLLYFVGEKLSWFKPTTLLESGVVSGFVQDKKGNQPFDSSSNKFDGGMGL